MRPLPARVSRALAVAWFAAIPAALVGFGWFLRTHDWEWGRERSGVLALLAIAVLLARPACPSILRSKLAAALVWAAALVALAIDVRTGVESVRLAARAGVIRLDQGQNTLRAARLLLRGENPYAQGQLLDLEAYGTRREQRGEAGLMTPSDPRRVQLLLGRWWATLDASARDELLPAAPSGNPMAARERALYGYKYGPLLPLITASVQALAGPAAVPLLQLAWWGALLALVFACLRASGVERGPAGLAVLCASLEPSISTNFLYYSASDVWALAPMAAALLAFLRGRPVALGLCVAAAMGCKLLPSALLAPLLLVAPRWRIALLAWLAGLAAVFAPFIVADPTGLWANLALWPSAMRPDNTHWSFYASPSVRMAARALLGSAIAAGAVYLVARRERAADPWLRYLAAGSAALILAGVAFHNNYAPWFTVWALCAVVAAGSSPSASAQAPAPSGNR